jgi:hypothetical protein
LSAASADDPQISTILERDGVAAHRGMAEETCSLGVGPGGDAQSEGEGDRSTGHWRL